MTNSTNELFQRIIQCKNGIEMLHTDNNKFYFILKYSQNFILMTY